MSDLRTALEARLGSLPRMQHDNGYPVEALPKAELLDLLALHPDRELVHLMEEGAGFTSCCGRTPFDLPRTERITVDPAVRNCGLPALVVTEKAVQAAAKKRAQHYESEYDSTHLTWQDFAGEAREILTAALPFLGAALLATRERVSEVLTAHKVGRHLPLAGERGIEGYHAVITDALLAAGVFREPPTQEELAKALHEHDLGDLWDDAGCNDNGDGSYPSCKQDYLERARTVLALLDGAL